MNIWLMKDAFFIYPPISDFYYMGNADKYLRVLVKNSVKESFYGKEKNYCFDSFSHFP